MEAQRAIEDGADEVDMVMAVGLLREGPQHYAEVEEDIRSVVEAVHKAGGKTTKVIIETCYLNPTEKEAACHIVTRAGAEFIKTSTGYGPGGATLEDAILMRKLSGPNTRVKAAGGIRTLAQCLEYIHVGVERLGIGLSGALPILEEVRKAKAS
jgi:deoxyribose-phosphate aldolase